MTSPHDLLPRWLVYHDVAAEAAATPNHFNLSQWDDGFTPSGCRGRSGKIVRDFPRGCPGLFAVVEQAVSERTANLLYASAVRARVWGVYVHKDELHVHASETSQKVHHDLEREEAEDPDAYRHALARATVEEFLLGNEGNEWITKKDWARTHGVAVWVIASDCNDETEYHLDYAEQVRYETNVIVPPIYGATVHVSPLRSSRTDETLVGERPMGVMEGGDFHVNVTGLDHYATYGYKTRKHDHRLTTDELETRSTHEVGWKRVSYNFRRGILCDGEFPHFSSRVRTLVPGASESDLPLKRVVVGLNLFPSEIGACVAQFPEHSRAFNRYVKLSQAAVKQTARLSSNTRQDGGWTLDSVRANPKQAAFLKLLVRKVREQKDKTATAST